MKVFSLSNRFYYREFPDLKNIILHDLRVYNGVSGITPLERQVGMQIGSYYSFLAANAHTVPG